MSAERREQVTHVRMESTGNRRSSLVLAEAGRLPRGDTSRMNREIHVRICEGLGVKLPGSTRPSGLRGPPRGLAFTSLSWIEFSLIPSLDRWDEKVDPRSEIALS